MHQTMRRCDCCLENPSSCSRACSDNKNRAYPPVSDRGGVKERKLRRCEGSKMTLVIATLTKSGPSTLVGSLWKKKWKALNNASACSVTSQ